VLLAASVLLLLLLLLLGQIRNLLIVWLASVLHFSLRVFHGGLSQSNGC